MKRIAYIYKKTSENTLKIVEFLRMYEFSAQNCHSFIDSNRDFINYKKMKEQVKAERGIVIVNSLHSIAYSKESVLEELEWFKSNRIELIILDMPSTWIVGVPEKNLQSVKVLIDVFLILKNYNNFEFQNPDFVDGGRKKIKFPANWESLYKLYEVKQISASEFQQKSGLKRATFFNLLSEYKDLARHKELEFACFEDDGTKSKSAG